MNKNSPAPTLSPDDFQLELSQVSVAFGGPSDLLKTVSAGCSGPSDACSQCGC